MPDTRIEVAALNIVASPHPPGIYKNVLTAIANREIELWGSDRAKITPPAEVEGRSGILWGEILVWAEIDKAGPWLNKETNLEATPNEKQEAVEAIPDNLEPNFRSFFYALNEKRHRIVFEVRNELGSRFSPKRCERMFGRLIETLPPEFPSSVDLTVIPEDETLSNIFAIPRLRRLEIFIKRPNADDAGDESDRIMKKLEAQGARSQKVELVKAPKIKTIQADNDTRMMAEIASLNGYVTGEGKDAHGNPVIESTAEHPKVRWLDVNTSVFAAFMAGIPLFD